MLGKKKSTLMVPHANHEKERDLRDSWGVWLILVLDV